MTRLNHEKAMDRQILFKKEFIELGKLPKINENESIDSFISRTSFEMAKRFANFHQASGGFIVENEESVENDLKSSGCHFFNIGDPIEFDLPPSLSDITGIYFVLFNWFGPFFLI